MIDYNNMIPQTSMVNSYYSYPQEVHQIVYQPDIMNQ